MSVYADASLLVALLAPDVFNERADAFLDRTTDDFLISDFAAAEFASALSLRHRRGGVSEDQVRRAFDAFDSWSARFGPRLETTTAEVARAETLVRRLTLGLRMPDALNIAIAERHGATLATFDVRMAEAAQALGLEIAPT